eukprot:4247100-Alexandrium_andersonii.AAC.1
MRTKLLRRFLQHEGCASPAIGAARRHPGQRSGFPVERRARFAFTAQAGESGALPTGSISFSPAT